VAVGAGADGRWDRLASGVAVVVVAVGVVAQAEGGTVTAWAGPALSGLDARVLRATDPLRERTAGRVAGRAGCSEEVAVSCLRRLRGRMLVEVDGRRPMGWLRTRRGDLALEHTP
jgi:hypothetical protein